MQPVSRMCLYSLSPEIEGVTKAQTYFFSGNKRCVLSNCTFQELLKQRLEEGKPCLIIRVKDVVGGIHLFEGCNAVALQSFMLPGFFKPGLSPEWKPCSYVQYFKFSHGTAFNGQQTLIGAPDNFHFVLETSVNYYVLHGQMFLRGSEGVAPDYTSAKRFLEKALKKDSKNEQALVLLGEMFLRGYGVSKNTEKAKEYFDRALTINPHNETALTAVEYLNGTLLHLFDHFNLLSLEDASDPENMSIEDEAVLHDAPNDVPNEAPHELHQNPNEELKCHSDVKEPQGEYELYDGGEVIIKRDATKDTTTLVKEVEIEAKKPTENVPHAAKPSRNICSSLIRGCEIQ